MNRREYERAIRDTRKALYKGDLGGVAVGVLRALVAHKDPNEVEPRLLNPAPPRARKLAGTKKRAKVKR